MPTILGYAIVTVYPNGKKRMTVHHDLDGARITQAMSSDLRRQCNEKSYIIPVYDADPVTICACCGQHITEGH